MPPWLIYALLSVTVLAIAEISQKVSLTRKENISSITNNFYVWVIQGTVGLVLCFIFGKSLNVLNTSIVIKLGILGSIYFLAGAAFYNSYKGNSPSISIIFGTISVIVGAFLGATFLKESLSFIEIIGIILILASILVLNFNRTEKISKYSLYALLGGVFYGVAHTIDKSFVLTLSPFVYLTLFCYSIAIVSLVVTPKLITSESRKLGLQAFTPIVTAAFSFSLYNLFTFFSYNHGGELGAVGAINNTDVFMVILVEVLFLHDKSNLKRKIIAALLAVIGIGIFSLYVR